MHSSDFIVKDLMTSKEIFSLLNNKNAEKISRLFTQADNILLQYNSGVKNQIGTIEISNYCRQHCHDCNACMENSNRIRFRMTQEEIITSAHEISNRGIRNILLQCGDDSCFHTDLIAYLIYKIKEETNAKLILCMGNRKENEYKEWKIAGADLYLIRNWLEEPKILSRSQKEIKIKNLISKVKSLQEIGYQVGIKNFFHIPITSLKNVSDFIFLFRDLNVSLISMVACNGKRAVHYYSQKDEEIFLIYKIIAVMRMLLSDVNIQEFYLDGLPKAKDDLTIINAGADTIMHDFTPAKYRKDCAEDDLICKLKNSDKSENDIIKVTSDVITERESIEL